MWQGTFPFLLEENLPFSFPIPTGMFGPVFGTLSVFPQNSVVTSSFFSDRLWGMSSGRVIEEKYPCAPKTCDWDQSGKYGNTRHTPPLLSLSLPLPLFFLPPFLCLSIVLYFLYIILYFSLEFIIYYFLIILFIEFL